MKNTNLFELFPNEYRDLILRYQKKLKDIFNDYQVVIFMARKAVCFYKSLIVGEFMDKPQKCEVFSSRILTYNVLNQFRGKRVIVIDDIMIKGDSLKNALSVLSTNGIDADVYIMARPVLNKKDIKKDVLSSLNIIDTYAELTIEDTFQLSKHIADFIESCICPYNIDQPIYKFRNYNAQMVSDFVSRYNLVDISSNIQRNYGISSYSLEISNAYIANSTLKEHVELCKIRFYYGKYNDKDVFLAVPFVLLNELSTSEVDGLFSAYANEKMLQFICNDNEKIVCENKLKIIHYIFSAQLMETFIKTSKITNPHRLNGNDNFVFSIDALQIVADKPDVFNFEDRDIINDIEYDFEFQQNEYFEITYEYLYSNKMFYHYYYDAENTAINSELLILSNLKEYIKSVIGKKVNALIFSNVIDSLIDKGLIIPSVIHGNDSTIIRAYKCGEVYALNQRHFLLFTYALRQYLKGIKHERLQKTEFEKLCVLFFREAVHSKILQYSETTGNEDEYSICYSKFGPRISTSKPVYSADETSTLASKLITIQLIDTRDIVVGTDEAIELERTDDFQEFKYPESYKLGKVNENEITNQSWVLCADSFSRKYKLLYKALFVAVGDEDEILFDDVRNMHMRTYLEFLVMLSIGFNRKEQLLSLLAEVYLFDSIEVTDNIRQTLFNYGRVLDGLISGMWKYMCYSQKKHPLKKVIENLDANDTTEHLSVFISDALKDNLNSDQNENIEPLLHDAGKLIYSIVYSIWFMYEKYRIVYKMRDKRIDLSINYKREFYFRDLSYLRDSIWTQINDKDQPSTTEQNLQTLRDLKSDARRLLGRYNSEIAKGKKQNGTSEQGNIVVNISATGTKVEGNVKQLSNFENGGVVNYGGSN